MKNTLKKCFKAAALLGLMLSAAGARAESSPRDVAFRVGGNDFLIPFKSVSAIQLYSFEEGKGFPALETVLVSRKTWRVSVGAAAVLGTGVNVPFVSLSTRLSPSVFDTANNDLYFGAWVGKPSNGEKAIYGISASTALW